MAQQMGDALDRRVRGNLRQRRSHHLADDQFAKVLTLQRQIQDFVLTLQWGPTVTGSRLLPFCRFSRMTSKAVKRYLLISVSKFAHPTRCIPCSGSAYRRRAAPTTSSPGDFHNAAGFDTGGRDAHVLPHAPHDRAPQVGIPATSSDVVRVADRISIARLLAADFTCQNTVPISYTTTKKTPFPPQRREWGTSIARSRLL
jgi:hypothetical protein